jgi:hypothetical protein
VPLYDYLCECGVVTEARRGINEETIPCPACGQPAKRQAVYRVSLRGLPTLGPPDNYNKRQQFADFREASQEVDHAHAQREKAVGHPIEVPSYYEIGKARAKELQKAGVKSIKEVRR